MKCVSCSAEWPLPKVHFSSVCEGCGCWLHSCVQCGLWDASSETCRSTTTDPVADREGKNFCEEWQPHGRKTGTRKPSSGAERFNKLFGS